MQMIFITFYMERFLKYFIDHLKVERGLSQNTVDAYCSDLCTLGDYLQDNNINDWGSGDIGAGIGGDKDVLPLFDQRKAVDL